MDIKLLLIRETKKKNLYVSFFVMMAGLSMTASAQAANWADKVILQGNSAGPGGPWNGINQSPIRAQNLNLNRCEYRLKLNVMKNGVLQSVFYNSLAASPTLTDFNPDMSSDSAAGIIAERRFTFMDPLSFNGFIRHRSGATATIITATIVSSSNQNGSTTRLLFSNLGSPNFMTEQMDFSGLLSKIVLQELCSPGVSPNVTAASEIRSPR